MKEAKILIKKAISKRIKSQKELQQLNRQIASRFSVPCITNAVLLKTYKSLIKRNLIKENKTLVSLLRKRKIRTISGVSPIAVLTKPYPCKGTCIYCPSEKSMPKSYLSNEPAVMRAILAKFDPEKQIKIRLNTLKRNGHPTDKIELIIMGGTFSFLPKKYQTNFIKKCIDTLNEKRTRNLKQAMRFNEKANHRLVGLTLETRPDCITVNEVKRFRRLGATRIEMGVQSIYNDVLKFNKRGHDAQTTIRATKLLKDAGFKIGYHMMPNLPKSTLKKDFKMFQEIFLDPNYKPDLLKIYPCVITKNSKLYKLWKQGKYRPYTEEQLKNLLIKIKQIIPLYVRITRLIRDIPSESIVAGNKISNLRQLIHVEMKEQGLKCRCIRCREIKGQKLVRKNIKLVKREYEASEGKEIFLSFEDVKNDFLIAILRLRIPSQTLLKKKHFLKVLQNSAIIREVHTYGIQVPIGKYNRKIPQHLGYGKKLIKEAEKIIKSMGIKKVAVISGVGVRDYYRKLGYKLDGDYMTKKL